MATAQQQNMDTGVSHKGESTRDLGGKVTDKAKDIAANVGGKMGEAASYLGKKADDATSAMGKGLKSVAGTIRENTPPEQGVLRSATSAVADTIESGGRYLEEHGVSNIGDDLTNLIRRNPLPAFLVGVGLGFLVARATRLISRS